jgi:hypothetical protein
VSRPARRPAIALALAGAVLAAGCGSAAAPSRGPGTQPPPPAPSLNTSLVTAAGTWSVAVMGGSAAQHNNFWQLFMRPAGTTRWKLVTPPGTADNGGLVLAGSGQSLLTGLRPSQDLTYTPLAVTASDGRGWSSAGPLDAALADVPDALASAPGGRNLLALLADGTATLAAPGYASWTTLTSRQALAATPPGRRCGLRNLTAAAYSPARMPLLAGACAHAGTAGIFAYTDEAWHPAGPQLPPALARDNITVLMLTTTAGRTTALLAASAGSATSLLAAWTAGNGSHWALSPPFPLNGAKLTSASPGPRGTTAIVLNGNRGQAIGGPGTSWRLLPRLPPGTATLAPGPAGGLDALAVHRTTLTVWHIAPGGAGWHTTQTINVPILFGSSS